MQKMQKMLKMLRRQTIIEVQTPRVQPRRPILLPWAGQEKVGGGGPPRGVTIRRPPLGEQGVLDRRPNRFQIRQDRSQMANLKGQAIDAGPRS